MNYKLDQSGKIENTAKDTVICISNGTWDAILIPARSKRKIQSLFRRNGKIASFIYFTFAAGITILLERNPHMSSIMIDREYTGHEASIFNIVKKMLVKKNIHILIFWGNIGKKTGAHIRSLEIARGRIKPKVIITEQTIFELIKKTEVGKRLKDI